MSIDPELLVATTRQHELQAAARRDALVRLATCCHPSAWRRRAAALRERLRPAPCCA